MEINHLKSNQRPIAFIHGRPHGHPIHALYANAVQADFFYEDRLLRWHDVPGASKPRRYLSWILNALFFPDKRRYAIYFTECVRLPQFIMKVMGIMRPHQKLVTLLADESLYFVYSRRYSRLTARLIVSFLKSTDALICIGAFQTELAKQILGKTHHSKIHTIFNGVPEKIHDRLREGQYQTRSKNILFIGDAHVAWRILYKGIDVMIEAFAKAHKNDRQLRFILVGNINRTVLEPLLMKCEDETRQAIIFVGRQPDVQRFISDSGLYLHCSRGDAFPTAVLEAMAGGLVPLISTVTGTSEVVQQVDSNLIVPLTGDQIAERIRWFFQLDEDVKEGLSTECRRVIQGYTERNALLHFRNTFDQIASSLTKQPDRI